MIHRRTNSDAGAVKVGTATFTTLIGNGMGDGITEVYILGADEKVPENANFESSIEGEFNIYSSDCGDAYPIFTMRGRYGVYSNEGEVYFEKWWED